MTDDACIVSRSPQGLAKMMGVIAEVCRSSSLRVNRVGENDRDHVMPPPCTSRTMVRVQAAG